MALQIYAFKDKTQVLELMVRAKSVERAKEIFEIYLSLLNSDPITSIEVKREIYWGNLRTANFNASGIINGGLPAPLVSNIALGLSGSSDNGGAIAPGVVVGGSHITVVAYVQFADYDARNEIISHGAVPNFAFNFYIDSGEIVMDSSENGGTIDQGVSIGAPLVNGEGIWVRCSLAVFQQPEAGNHFFVSSNPRKTDIHLIVWDFLNNDTTNLPAQIESTSSTYNIGVGSTGLDSPTGFIWRAVLSDDTPIGPLTDVFIADMYPARDANIEDDSWKSTGSLDEEIYTLSGGAFLAQFP